MSQEDELKKIKKKYGENFMKLCRSLFPTLLENEGLLSEVLDRTFANNGKTLYEDILESGFEEDFKRLIYSKVDVEAEQVKIVEDKTPYELLDEVGYELIECNSEKEIQSFKKYYAEGEALCTFRGGRLNSCVVFFAVKKDVKDIKRKDFKHPKREDEYGTSVMGIQFNKSGLCTVSIKNRYNHTVNNPDATYGNDLDRITPGLEASFERLLSERGLEFSNGNIEGAELPGYVVAGDGKYYKYNVEVGGVYFCAGNIVIENGEAHQIGDPSEVELVDNFVIDKKNKTIQAYGGKRIDSFVDAFDDIRKIDIQKSKDEDGKDIRKILIYNGEEQEPIVIETDKNNQIIGYENQTLTETKFNFMIGNTGLRKLHLPSLEKVGINFLNNNSALEELSLPKVQKIGDYFLHYNTRLRKLDIPSAEHIGDYFLTFNIGLKSIDIPNAKQVGDCSLISNEAATELIAPKLERVGTQFLINNEGITKIDLPNLRQADEKAFRYNQNIVEINAPKLTEVDFKVFDNVTSLQKLNMPKSKFKQKLSKKVERGKEDEAKMQNNDDNSQDNNTWMNRFSGWYSAIDRVSENAKGKFVKMKSDILKAISERLKERTNNRQINIEEQDANEK